MSSPSTPSIAEAADERGKSTSSPIETIHTAKQLNSTSQSRSCSSLVVENRKPVSELDASGPNDNEHPQPVDGESMSDAPPKTQYRGVGSGSIEVFDDIDIQEPEPAPAREKTFEFIDTSPNIPHSTPNWTNPDEIITKLPDDPVARQEIWKRLQIHPEIFVFEKAGKKTGNKAKEKPWKATLVPGLSDMAISLSVKESNPRPVLHIDIGFTTEVQFRQQLGGLAAFTTHYITYPALPRLLTVTFDDWKVQVLAPPNVLTFYLDLTLDLAAYGRDRLTEEDGKTHVANGKRLEGWTLKDGLERYDVGWPVYEKTSK